MSDTQVTLLSPYKCATVVNGRLAELGIDKVLPPQMFYTYVKKGYLPSKDGKVTLTDLATWMDKYLTKNFPTVTV